IQNGATLANIRRYLAERKAGEGVSLPAPVEAARQNYIERALAADAVRFRAAQGNLNLSNENLSDFDLGGITLSGANLSGANLSGANLSGTNLTGANLTGADVTQRQLDQAC